MNIEDTVTITEAAAIMAVSRQSVHNAIKADRIKVMAEVAGRKLLRRADVEAYKRSERGPKSNPPPTADRDGGAGEEGREGAG